MKATTGLVLLAIVIVLTMGAAGTTFAQSASQSMEKAGTDVKNAAVNVYHGTKTAATDSDVTAKVKLALHDDSLTKDSTIHVTTVAGVVTLRGTVLSSSVSERAEKVAHDTTGVKSVRNHLKVPPG